jgi:subtilisin family serine protease
LRRRVDACAGVAAALVTSLAASPAGGASALRPVEDAVPGRLLVRLDRGATGADMRLALAAAGATAVSRIPAIDTIVVGVPPGGEDVAAAILSADPDVLAVERDAFVHAADVAPNDPLWTAQTGPREISAPAAWAVTRGAPSTILAVLDSGVDAAHSELAGKLVPGYDALNGDSDPADDNGHGTSVAGVAAAETNNGTGLAGVCWLCSIMPVKVVDASGTGTTSSVAAGIVWATDHGARVVNMSVAGPAGTDTLAAAVRYAADGGVLMVAAAGNDGAVAPTYPASYPGVVAVGATVLGRTLYPFSNRGSWVALTAPGCTTAPSRTVTQYTFFCGTSAAAPLVAGVAGLVVSAAPGASAATVRQVLETTATPAGDGSVAYGAVDAYRAVAAVAGTPSRAGAPPASDAATPPGSAARRSPGTAPRARSRPTIAGRPYRGRTLRGGRGVWSGTAPLRFRLQWQRCAPRDCRRVFRTSGTRYRLTLRDVGFRIRLVVTAANAFGGAVSVSRSTPAIAATHAR